MASTSAAAALNQYGGQEPGVVPYERLPQLLELIGNIKQSAEEMNRAVALIAMLSDSLDFPPPGQEMGGGIRVRNPRSLYSTVSGGSSPGPGNQSSAFSGYSQLTPLSQVDPGSQYNNFNTSGQNQFNSNLTGISASSNFSGGRAASPPPRSPAYAPRQIPPLHGCGYFMGYPVLMREPEMLLPPHMYEHGPRNLIMHSPPPVSPPSQVRPYSPPPMASSPPPDADYAPCYPQFNITGGSDVFQPRSGPCFNTMSDDPSFSQ